MANAIKRYPLIQKTDCCKQYVRCAEGLRKNQLRVAKKQLIPSRSQTIVCAKVSNVLPVNTVGLCLGGRRVTSLGIIVARTSTHVINNKVYVNVLIMNVSEEPNTLYPRTKLGTFNLIDPSELVPLTTLDLKKHEEHVSEVKTSANIYPCSNIVCSDITTQTEEILSKVKLKTDHMSNSETAEITRLISDYYNIFQVDGGPRGRYSGVKHILFTHEITLQLSIGLIDNHHTFNGKYKNMLRVCWNKASLENLLVLGVSQFVWYQKRAFIPILCRFS